MTLNGKTTSTYFLSSRCRYTFSTCNKVQYSSKVAYQFGMPLPFLVLQNKRESFFCRNSERLSKSRQHCQRALLTLNNVIYSSSGIVLPKNNHS